MIDPKYSWEKYTLADTFDFTSEDLAANRQGVLSERQKQRGRETFLMGRGCIVVFAIIVVPLFIIYVYTSLPNEQWLQITPFMLIIVGAALFVIWPSLRSGRKFLVPPPLIDHVDAVTGIIDVDQAVRIDPEWRQKGGPLYLLAIGDFRFLVSPRKLYLFDKTKRYSVYFIRTKAYPHRRLPDYPYIRILSIEEVPAEHS